MDDHNIHSPIWQNKSYYININVKENFTTYKTYTLKTWSRASVAQSIPSGLSIHSRGCEFGSQLGQHSFRCLTKDIETCFIRLSPMGCLTVNVEKQPVAWKVCCVVYWCGKTRKRMSRWTDRRDMTEKLLKTALNPNQSTTWAWKNL